MILFVRLCVCVYIFFFMERKARIGRGMWHLERLLSIVERIPKQIPSSGKMGHKRRLAGRILWRLPWCVHEVFGPKMHDFHQTYNGKLASQQVNWRIICPGLHGLWRLEFEIGFPYKQALVCAAHLVQLLALPRSKVLRQPCPIIYI